MAASPAHDSKGLIGYAVLRANFDLSQPSYVDNFRPFVLHCIARRHPISATAGELATDVHDTFGFTIPDHVVGTILKRAVKDKAADRTGGEYRLSSIQLDKIPDLQADIQRFSRQQSDLVQKFCDFVSLNAPDHIDLIAEQPDDVLIRYIEAHVAPLLSSALRGDDAGEPVDGLSGADYLANLFVAHLHKSDASTFGYVVEVVKGAILAAVVDLGSANLSARLNNLVLILDTPVLLKLLGYEGREHGDAIRQTVALAEKLKAKVAYFPHTLQEVDGVLASVAPVLRSRGARRGPLREIDCHFLDQGSGPADIEIARAGLVKNLANLGIVELRTPDTHYAYGLDETALDELLQAEVHYQRPGTRRYDVESISAVHRLRKGQSGREFERCGHVLVTDNRRLFRASQKVAERHGWPLAMLDSDLAGLLWVRQPAVADDLPRDQLLATVHAGMQPGRHLWARYLEEIEKLLAAGTVNDDDALILRSAPEARAALMIETLGEEDVGTESVKAVLERVHVGIEQPRRERLVAAELSRKAALEAAAQLTDQSESARTEAAEVTKKLDETQRALDVLVRERRARDASITAMAKRKASHMVGGTYWAIAVLLLIPFLLHKVAPKWSVEHVPGSATVFGWMGLSVTVLGVLVLLAGGSLKEWLDRFEHPLALHIERRQRRRLGLPPAEE